MTKPVLDHFADYLEVRSAEKLSEHTLLRYQTEAKGITALVARHLARPIEQVTPADLTPASMRAAFAIYSREGGAHGNGHGKSTLSGAWSTWNKFLNHLVQEGIVEGNPMAAVGKPRVPKGSPKPPDGGAETISMLLAAAKNGQPGTRRKHWPERDYALIACLVSLGVRRAELIGANIGHFGGPDGARRLRVLGKGDVQRFVPAPDALLAILEDFQRSRLERFPTKNGRLATSEPLLCNDGGQRLQPHQARYILDQVAAVAGVRGSFRVGAFLHGLRHAAAMMLVESGATAMDIREFLGHQSLATSQVYAASSDQRVREAAGKSAVVGMLSPAPSTPADERSEQ